MSSLTFVLLVFVIKNWLITEKSNPKPRRNLDYSVPAEEREKIGLGLLLPFAPIDSSSPFVSRSAFKSLLVSLVNGGTA